ncbi:MAG TPA: deoxyribonuclease IV [Nitrospirota bacterium]
MRIGFHISIAGGFPLAIDRAAFVGCTTMQIFSHSPRMWKVSDIKPDEAAAFIAARKKAGITPLFVHTSYLINLAAADSELHAKSIAALRNEMERAEILGAEFVVTHLGSASGSPEQEAMERVADGLGRALEGFTGNARLLIENTSGERGDVGCRFGDIAWIIKSSGLQNLGVTVDTCHSFGAGYDIKTKKGLDAAVRLMDETFGLSRLKLIHLNDSKHPLASLRDRHEDIGKGFIGEDGFRLILNHPKLKAVPMVMETPKSTPDDDIRNLAVAMRLREG